MSMPLERIKKLEEVEQDVTKALECAVQTLTEMCKEKPNAKQIEMTSTQFIKKLEGVEKTVIEQLQYLAMYSTGQSYEGSSYGRSKDVQMASQRLGHVKMRLNELQALSQERRSQRNQSNDSIPAQSAPL